MKENPYEIKEKNKIVVDFNKHHHYISNNVIHQMCISIFDISGAHLKRVRFKCQIQRRTKRRNKYRKKKNDIILRNTVDVFHNHSKLKMALLCMWGI